MGRIISFSFIIAFFLFVSNSFAALQDSIPGGRASQIIDSLRVKYAPDKRTAIFNTTFSDGLLTVETTEANAAKALAAAFKQNRIYISVDAQILPDTALNDTVYAVANLSVCNNRTTPANSAEMATQMLLGTPVHILKKEKGYYLVRTPDGYLSWTDEHALGRMNKSDFKLWQNSAKLVITAAFAQAYQEPAASAPPVSDLVNGNILRLSGRQGDFYKVTYPDKRMAYVRIADAEPFEKWLDRPAPTAQTILNTAKTMMGIPYLWGGTSVKGVDCSGFTKTSFFLNGIVIPRDASQQALVGREVDVLENDTVSIGKCLKNLQPGDLLFFAAGNKRQAGAKVTHTALYLGKGEFIQAAGMVRINSMLPSAANYDDFQTRTIVGARRYINSIGNKGITKVADHPFYK